MWNEGYCTPPLDVCGGAVINGKPAWNYCYWDIVTNTGGGTSKREWTTRESCAKKTYSPPTSCQCEWADRGECEAPWYGPCAAMELGNGSTGRSHCSSIDSQSQCEGSRGSWLLPAIHQLFPGVRHPSWCLSSMGTVIVPSVIANIMLLTM